ncbi:MAG TPA: site-2 protease family protein [Thermoanaerobaculia bacterium]|nr:site-2 protease family protein [Thermoanaerobaculia bacterium]
MNCAQCDTALAPARLSCPICQRLVHAAELQALAAGAGEAARAGDATAELSAWRQALDLLPLGTRQRAIVAGKVEELSRRVDTASPLRRPAPRPDSWQTAAAGGGGREGLARGGALATAAAFLLTKGKLLLLGLTKSSVLLSMILSLALYWTVFGWKFALGLILSLYVHEMGHVAALQRFGIRASWPMFIPGLGALVLLRQHPANPREDARIGLAGPIWGLGAALAAYAAFRIGGWPICGAIAAVGAWINLFNLLPVWQLDGGRAWNALSRSQRVLAAAGLAITWAIFQEPLLLILLLAATFRAASRNAPVEGDPPALGQYLFLLVSLAALATLKVPMVHARP